MSYSITAKEGNLLSEAEATFIVNASNTTLTLGSGVSMAFKRHCGNELQKEMIAKIACIKRLMIYYIRQKRQEETSWFLINKKK